MPSITATAQAAMPASISLKASSSLVSPSSANSTLHTLRSLYPRAAKAFLQRNVALTHSLLTSAFSIIEPPPPPPGSDPIASQRRKWEILRITFETTLYASPPRTQDLDELPAPLRADLMLSPEPFIATIHTRALQLFTPASTQKPTSAFLPAQILVTLALAGLKLECTVVGKGIIEDWLARHGQEEVTGDPDGYAKVLELYCLHVLPRLEEWDYAESFLQYEHELPIETRKFMMTSLRALHAQAQAALHRSSTPSTPKGIQQPMPEPLPQSSRSVSPAGSTSSASSGSTHTATPTTPHPGGMKGKAAVPSVARLTSNSTSASSQSISSTATSRTVTPASVERRRSRSTQRRRGRRDTRTADERSDSSVPSAISPLPRPPRAHPLQPVSPRPPSTLALLRSSFDALVQRMSRTKVAAYLLLFVVFPLLSFVFRVRRRRASGAGNGAHTSGTTVEEVRRRLRSSALMEGKGGAGGFVWQMWMELVRAVSDTVQMGGRGLV